MSDLLQKLAENAVQPKKMEVDGRKVEQHSLSEQLDLAKYVAGQKAMKSRTSGIKFQKMTHSGAV